MSFVPDLSWDDATLEAKLKASFFIPPFQLDAQPINGYTFKLPLVELYSVQSVNLFYLLDT